MRKPFLVPLVMCVSCLAGLAAVPTDSEKPEALRAAEQARLRLQTARIEFHEKNTTPLRGEASPAQPRERYFTWKCAGDSYITVDQGDQEGVVMRDGEGRPRDDLPYHGPMHFLVMGDEVWEHVQESQIGEVSSPDARDFWHVYDLRTVGLDAGGLGTDFEERLLQAGAPAPQYSVSVEEGLTVVTATVGAGMFRWWIDPEKDWNVVRTGVWHDRKQVGEMRFTLAQTDGIWFPQRIEKFRLAGGDIEPSTVITVLSAEFNRPYHPQELTPTDIGLEVGATIHFWERDGAPLLIWDGKRPVPPEEFLERVKSGELEWGPAVVRRHERALADFKAKGESVSVTTRPSVPAAVDPRAFESQWETYTRQFIVKFRLDSDQARRAWEICRDCEDRGRRYIAERRSDFDDWQGRRDELKQAASADREREEPRLEKRRRELAAPLDRIFEERLKPGLDKLPTPAQRKAAEAKGGPERQAESPTANVRERELRAGDPSGSLP